MHAQTLEFFLSLAFSRSRFLSPSVWRSLCACGIEHALATIHNACCSVFRCVAVCCSVLQCAATPAALDVDALQCVAVCCSVLQCAATPAALDVDALQCAAVCCGVLQCAAVCCCMRPLQ